MTAFIITGRPILYLRAILRLRSEVLTVGYCYCSVKQVALLSQRDRAILRAVDDFAKSLKVTQGHSK